MASLYLALERAAKFGDGWCPFFSIATHSKLNQDTGISSIADLQNKIAYILERRQQLGRSGQFDVNIAFSSTNMFEKRPRDEAEQFVEQLHQLQEAGVNWVTLKLPHPSRAAYLEYVEWFGKEVVEYAV